MQRENNLAKRLSKLGSKNPMWGKKLSVLHKRKISKGLKEYYQKYGVSSEKCKRISEEFYELMSKYFENVSFTDNKGQPVEKSCADDVILAKCMYPKI